MEEYKALTRKIYKIEAVLPLLKGNEADTAVGKIRLLKDRQRELLGFARDEDLNACKLVKLVLAVLEANESGR